MSVQIFIEGGGDSAKTKDRLRAAFNKLFAKALLEKPIQPKPILCGSRSVAYEQFCDYLRRHSGAMCLLLVDSESAVRKGDSVWQHLLRQDHWAKPSDSTDDQAHLMVQCMEAWFLADRNVLVEYYGDGFLVNRLPATSTIEEIPKSDLKPKLKSAAENTSKKRYDETKHGADILSGLDPSKISEVSPHAKRFFEILQARCASVGKGRRI